MAPLWRPVKIGNSATAPNYPVIITYEKSSVKNFLTFFLIFFSPPKPDAAADTAPRRVAVESNPETRFISAALDRANFARQWTKTRPAFNASALRKNWKSSHISVTPLSLWYYYNIFFQNVLIFRSKLLKSLKKSLRRQK